MPCGRPLPAAASGAEVRDRDRQPPLGSGWHAAAGGGDQPRAGGQLLRRARRAGRGPQAGPRAARVAGATRGVRAGGPSVAGGEGDPAGHSRPPPATAALSPWLPGRPETELLVRMALEALPAGAPTRVLDLCAGSGAVGVSVAAERPQARVDLVELSPDGAAVAGRNAQRHAPGRAQVFCGDLFQALPENLRYDAIAANPPYVPLPHATQMAPEIVDHEPHLALFAGADGLDVIRQMVAGLPEW